MMCRMSKKPVKRADSQINIKNKKAYFDYELVEKVEAGISLVGTEVKSLRGGLADLDGSYAKISGNECWLTGCKITPYEMAGHTNHEADRPRKLLLHKKQIEKIKIKLSQRGFTLVPLRIYFNNRGLAKVEIALARGKKQYDKRAALQKAQVKLDMDRAMKKYRH